MSDYRLLLILLLAHFLGDFFLQPKKWVLDKEARKLASPFLYVHCGIHGILVYALTGFGEPIISLLVFGGHLVIDAGKMLSQQAIGKRLLFLLDQLLHLCLLAGVWVWHEQFEIDWQLALIESEILFITSLTFLTMPASIAIRFFISRWTPESHLQADHDTPPSVPLKSAGSAIGMIERVLIFLFIVFGSMEAVGFLLAAKSVFRFGELKNSNDLQRTEYVLIGTLASFALAIVTALLFTYLQPLF